MMTGENMPQKEKDRAEDGFSSFFLDVQKKVQERDAAFIREMAASMWENMTPDDRWAYEEQVRNKEQNLSHVESKNKFRPRRIYCPWLERLLNRDNGQNRSTQEIEETVRMIKQQNSLKTRLFHLVHVNYYCKLRSGRYLGGEIALAEFSFVDGIRKTYHAFINPGKIPAGFPFLENETATKIHLTPMPLDGFRSESAHQEILSNIRIFLLGEDGDETNLPPLYTRPGNIEAVESVLWQLNEGPGQHMNAGRENFRVYSVCNLFHEIRNASMVVPSEIILPPNFLDERVLSNPDLEYTKGISCKFHEQQLAMRFCSLWHVQTWSFHIMDECCGPLEIEIFPGKHRAFSAYLTKRARAKHQLHCCNPKDNSQEKH
jgi:protein maelstrom